MKYLLRIHRWLQLFVWGYCPKCNGDSPEYFECNVCTAYHLTNRYKKPSAVLKKIWWANYLLDTPRINAAKKARAVVFAAEYAYRKANPNSKMDVPSIMYEEVERKYDEFVKKERL